MVDAPAARVILPGSTVGETNMGTFDVAFSIRSADTDRTLQLVGLVDTGALYSVVPGSVLDDLGIARDEEEQFVLADGSIVQMSIGLARFEIDERARTVHVAFGHNNDVILLGAMTLDRFGVATDPVHRRLIPAQLTL